MLFHQEHELSKRVQSAREAEWEKITQLEQAKLQVSNTDAIIWVNSVLCILQHSHSYQLKYMFDVGIMINQRTKLSLQ